jgi:hypothetical protein
MPKLGSQLSLSSTGLAAADVAPIVIPTTTFSYTADFGYDQLGYGGGTNWGGWFVTGPTTADRDTNASVGSGYFRLNTGVLGSRAALTYFDTFNQDYSGNTFVSWDGAGPTALNALCRSVPPYGNGLYRRVSDIGNAGYPPGYDVPTTDARWEEYAPYGRRMTVGQILTVTCNFTLGPAYTGDATAEANNGLRFGIFDSFSQGTPITNTNGVLLYPTKRINNYSSANMLSNSDSAKFGADNGYKGYIGSFNKSSDTSGVKILRKVQSSIALITQTAGATDTLATASNASSTRILNGNSYKVTLRVTKGTGTNATVFSKLEGVGNTTLDQITYSDTAAPDPLCFDTFAINLRARNANYIEVTGFTANLV